MEISNTLKSISQSSPFASIEMRLILNIQYRSVKPVHDYWIPDVPQNNDIKNSTEKEEVLKAYLLKDYGELWKLFLIPTGNTPVFSNDKK